jgi:hypothetical protein
MFSGADMLSHTFCPSGNTFKHNKGAKIPDIVHCTVVDLVQDWPVIDGWSWATPVGIAIVASVSIRALITSVACVTIIPSSLGKRLSIDVIFGRWTTPPRADGR